MKPLSRKEKILTQLVGAGFLLLIVAAVFAPAPLDWSYSFSRSDDIPFGDKLVFESLPDLFPGEEIVTSWTAPHFFLDDKIPLNTNFIYLNGRIKMELADVEALLKTAEAGSHVFIASERVYGVLADTFKLSYKPEFVGDMDFFSKDSVGFFFANNKLKSGFGYWYPKWMTRFYFNRYDTSRVTVLGHDDKGNVNFIKTKIGKGYFYFHCNPLAFTNYHLLSRNNGEYICKALSYLPVQSTVWDEYYKPGSMHSEGLFDYVLNNRSLRLAWYSILFGVLSLFIFGSKRVQRPIPEIKKPKNSSLSFVDTIAKLYYRRQDHLDIARKRFTYFLEFLRTKYFVNTSSDESRIIAEVSLKSGISERSVASLFQMGNRLGDLHQISQEDLEHFNRQIDFFYNNCK
ncbi:DUF4350 domain-containing protein [Thermophagus sp. OGC60D27]|uniref:DUF4350 domain-containing protein n=1 Tax=Thermophagus sp. OGC60D27 TaxID=3458415 RepID=UPI00403823E3